MYKLYGLYEPNGSLRYIGYTSKTLKLRLQWHINHKAGLSFKCHKLCWIESLKKKGLKPVIELIFETDSLEEVKKLEIYWIKFYKDSGIKLVNSTKGGDGVHGLKWTQEMYDKKCFKVCQYTSKGKLLRTHSSLSQASLYVSGDKKNNGKISGVCRGLRGRRTYMGFVFRYEGDAFDKYPVTGQWNVTEAQRKAISKRQTKNNVMKNRTGKLHPRARAISMYINGIKKDTFESIAAARKSTKISKIDDALKDGKPRKGIIWKYE